MKGKGIYLDHAATTPVREEVITAMLPYWTERYGNPASVHQFGRIANRGLESARSMLAESLQTDPEEIIFTGCGSESDNLALRGVMLAARASGGGNHLITCAIEHKAILDTAKQLRDLYDFDVTILPVDRHGQLDLERLDEAIRPDTVLISIMAANNEIGTLQPIEAIGNLAHKRGILFHSDAIQAAAVTKWDMRSMPIDLLSLAPHKFYGPKGIGILYARSGVELVSGLTGGGQEDGRRAGTPNVPYAVGAAKAFELAMEEQDSNIAHYKALRDRLIDSVLAAIPGECILTGHPSERLPHNASFAFRNTSGNDLLMHLDAAGVSASSGSACLTGNPEPASVLRAIGLGAEWTLGGLRLSVGIQNTQAEIDYVLALLPEVSRKLQRIKMQFV